MSQETCSKCGTTSGQDWKQCRGSCPMPMSPHYRPALIQPPKLSPEEARARVAKLLEILPAANPQHFNEMEDIARETLGWIESGQMPNLNEVKELCGWVLGLRELASQSEPAPLQEREVCGYCRRDPCALFCRG